MQKPNERDLLFWKNSHEGHTVLKKLADELNTVAETLVNKGLSSLADDHRLAREYAQIMGYVEGLKFVWSLIDDERENQKIMSEDNHE